MGDDEGFEPPDDWFDNAQQDLDEMADRAADRYENEIDRRFQ